MHEGMTPSEGVFWILFTMAMIIFGIDYARGWIARKFPS